jgi:predicted glycosyltransferase
MILFDLDVPKWVFFFEPIIKDLNSKGFETLIVSRGGDGYGELNALLDMKGLEYISIGEYGGASLENKLRESLNRQSQLIDIVKKYDVKVTVSGCVADITRVSYGLGIPIVTFYDLPTRSYQDDFSKTTHVTRLCMPFSNLVFKPFMIPDEIYTSLGLKDEQVITYDFLDTYIWLKDFKVDKSYVENKLPQIDYNKPIIVAREEEFKASYVDKKESFFYEAIKKLEQLDINLVIVPRYEAEPLKKEFTNSIILEEKIELQHLLAISSLFIGGGGTINSEAIYFGTPVISTRSFICHYDKYQIDSGLMYHSNDAEEIYTLAQKLIKEDYRDKAKEIFSNMNIDLDMISTKITSLIKS